MQTEKWKGQYTCTWRAFRKDERAQQLHKVFGPADTFDTIYYYLFSFFLICPCVVNTLGSSFFICLQGRNCVQIFWQLGVCATWTWAPKQNNNEKKWGSHFDVCSVLFLHVRVCKTACAWLCTFLERRKKKIHNVIVWGPVIRHSSLNNVTHNIPLSQCQTLILTHRYLCILSLILSLRKKN